MSCVAARRFCRRCFFAVVVLLIFAFAFDPGPADIERVGPGILWSALLFAAVLAIGRSMLTEREDGAIDGLLLAPIAAQLHLCRQGLCIAPAAAEHSATDSAPVRCLF